MALGAFVLACGMVVGYGMTHFGGERPKTAEGAPRASKSGSEARAATRGGPAVGPPASGPTATHRHKFTSFLTTNNARFMRLVPPQAQSLVHPSAIVVAGERLYCLYRGDVYVTPLASVLTGDENEPLPLENLLLPSRKVQANAQVRELLHISWDPASQLLICVDKSNDIYRYSPSTGRWAMEVEARNGPGMPDPHYVATAVADGRLFVLDYARNQIWHKRTGARVALASYFAKDVPAWEVKKRPGAHNLITAIDLVSTGPDELLALDEEGWLRTFRGGLPADSKRITLREKSTHLGAHPLDSWADLAVDPGYRYAYVADSDNARVLAVHAPSGRVAREFVVVPENGRPSRTHGIAFARGKLLVVAGNDLVVYPRDGEYDEASIADTQCQPDVLAIAHAAGLQDARLTAFTMPIREMLPDNISVFPGARRIYRHGIHEGVDFFDRDDPKDGGKWVTYGTQVYAAGDGEVLRADHDFMEMSPAKHRQALDACVASHETSRANENLFRGRQVWIRHPNGAVTVYAHLSGVDPAVLRGGIVRAGQPIARVGNSGTSAGVRQSRAYPHLHFEIWLNGFDRPDGEYVGRYLTPWETMRLWEKAFPGQSRRLAERQGAAASKTSLAP